MTAFVQQVGGASTIAGPTTSTGAVGGTFTAGNLLVALVNFSSSVAAGTDISIPAGWTAPLAMKSNGAPNGNARAYYIENNVGGAQTWTWTYTPGTSTGQGWAWTIFEFSGVASASSLDLTAISNATGASSSASLDTLAASGTTVAGDLLIHLAAVDRSAAGVLSTDTVNSVPTTNWNVGTQFQGTNAVPNAHAGGQYQILAGTQASPRGVLTSTISESSESFLLTFKAVAAPAATTYTFPARITNRYVGPQVLRYNFRQPQERLTEAPITPPNDPQGFAWPIRMGNRTEGPPVLRYGFRTFTPHWPSQGAIANNYQQALNATLNFIGKWWTGPMQVEEQNVTITSLISPWLGQNGTWSESDIDWWDSGGGWRLGFIPNYGGGLLSSWYELNSSGVVVGQNNDNLSTSRPDGIIHIATTESARFLGTEEGIFSTPTEQAPIGTGFRRGLQIRVPVAGADLNGFDYTVTDYIYPGDPGFRVVRLDMHNSGTQTLDGVSPGGLEFAMVAGLNNNSSEWPLSNSGYGFVGGAVTTPVPTAQTAGEPDYMYSTPGGSAGKILGIVGTKKTTIQDATFTNVNFKGDTNVTPRTKLYYQADATTVTAATRTYRVVTAFKRNMTQAMAVSIAADVKTPDTGGTFTGIANGTFTSFNDDEGAYEFATTSGNTLSFQHSISGNVTKRWLCVYKITGWTGTNPKIALAGTPLVRVTDYITYVDAVNSICYVKLMKGLVASGAGAGELNNGLISLTTSGILTQALTAGLSFVGAFTKSTSRSLAAGLGFTGNFSKQTFIPVAGGLSFTGNLPKQTNRPIPAGLSFVGTFFKSVNKNLPAGLSFTGAFAKFTSRSLAATLSFIGSLPKLTSRALPAGLSFVGGFSVSKLYVRALAAGLSFIGAFTKQSNKALPAGLSFTGAITKRTSRALAAGLSFTGTFNKQLSRALTAGLSFTGAFTKLTQKVLTGGLSFTGIFATFKITGGHLYTQALTATLNFSGAVSRAKFFHVTLNATLSFIGAIQTPAQRSMAFIASMAASGNLTSIRWYVGTFKEASQGAFRAAYRGIRSIITQNRNLQ